MPEAWIDGKSDGIGGFFLKGDLFDYDRIDPGSFLFNVLEYGSVCSTEGGRVTVCPNMLSPTSGWRKRILEADPEAVKVSLLNEGIHLDRSLGEEADSLRNRRTLRLDIRAGPFDYLFRTYGSFPVDVPHGTLVSRLSPFSIHLVGNGRKLSYYGLPIFDVVLDRSPVAPDTVRGDTPPDTYDLICRRSGNRLVVEHTDCCRFVKEGRGCQFCPRSSPSAQSVRFELDDIMEAIDAIPNLLPSSSGMSRRICIGGSSMDGSAREVRDRIVRMCDRILAAVPDAEISLSVLPPSRLSDLNDYKTAGVKSVSFNIDIYDRMLASCYMPGKSSVTLSTFFSALRYSTHLWKVPGSVMSMLMLGIERPEDTAEAVSLLASMGVTPVLYLYAPVPGTELERVFPASSEEIHRTYTAARDICSRYGTSLGPIPFDSQSKYAVFPQKEAD